MHARTAPAARTPRRAHPLHIRVDPRHVYGQPVHVAVRARHIRVQPLHDPVDLFHVRTHPLHVAVHPRHVRVQVRLHVHGDARATQRPPGRET